MYRSHYNYGVFGWPFPVACVFNTLLVKDSLIFLALIYIDIYDVNVFCISTMYVHVL